MIFFLGCGLSSLLIALASGPVTLMFGLGLLGLFTSMYHPIGLAHVTDIGKRTGRALAINGVWGNMGLAGAAITTGILAKTLGWQAAFVLPGLISTAIAALMYWRNLQHSKSDVTQTAFKQDNLVTTLRRVQFVVFGVICIAALFGGVVFNAITISLPKFFDERLIGIAGDLSWIGALTGAVFAIAAFAQLPVGELLDKYGARPILIVLLSGQIILLLLLSQATGLVALGLAILLVVMMFAQIPITSWLLSRYVRSNLRARAVSVEYTLSLGMGSATVPLIAIMHKAGYGFDVQFAALAISAGVVLVATFFLPQEHIAVDTLSL